MNRPMSGAAARSPTTTAGSGRGGWLGAEGAGDEADDAADALGGVVAAAAEGATFGPDAADDEERRGVGVEVEELTVGDAVGDEVSNDALHGPDVVVPYLTAEESLLARARRRRP